MSESLERRSAAVFYLASPGAGDGAVTTLARRAGFEDERVEKREGHGDRVLGRWAEMDGAYAWVEELPGLRALAIAFWQRLFYEAMKAGGDALLDESTLPEPARAFVAACRTLEPRAAFLASRRHQAAPEFIREVGSLAAGLDSYGLMDERLALLYLGPDAASLVANGALRGRDHLRVAGGLVVFAASGAERWM